MKGKAEARKHGFSAYDYKIKTRKKPDVSILKANEREEKTRFCGTRSRFALREKPVSAPDRQGIKENSVPWPETKMVSSLGQLPGFRETFGRTS
ncbi:hypothetical protein AVEN_114605-1 [Araneus ventricosus]|uniref:Uncharacterized protein n=1 Tax=Araneus ventricosus TaxID=182803 RepID=A0A4Y2GAW0_ARAVE|nr:hypothetical protein AVEN_114605-1 [Araneus ventricosus]